MTLAIHNGTSWNEKWINYCIKNKIAYLRVNCYETEIINQLKENGITHLMWHFHHSKAKDILMARNVLYAAAKMGIKTFPDFDTCWHFDDKISQKYLLEALDAPFKFIIHTNSNGKRYVKPHLNELENKIELHGFIPRKKLLPKMAQADFLINFDNGTSVQSPSKLIDYAIVRRPVLNLFDSEKKP